MKNYHESDTIVSKDTLFSLPKKPSVDYYKTDFLIGIPTSIVKFMVTDLEKGDVCAKELGKAKSEIRVLKEKNQRLISTIEEYEAIIQLNQNTIKNLSKNLKKQKTQARMFKIVAGALLVGFVLKVPEL